MIFRDAYSEAKAFRPVVCFLIYSQPLLKRSGIFLLMFAVLFSNFLYAASFKCSKAKTTQEKLICGDDRLSRLDDTLAQLYSEALRCSPSDPGELAYEQAEWLKKVRDTCRSAASLLTAMEERARFFRNRIGTNTQKPDSRSESVSWYWKKAKWKEWYPQIENKSKNETIDNVNSLIAGRFDSNPSEEDESCTGGSREKEVTLNAKGIFSMKIATYPPECSPMQSAHPPVPWDNHLAIDMRTGREIGFSGLFKDWENDKEKILEIVFGKEVGQVDTSCHVLQTVLEDYKTGSEFDAVYCWFTDDAIWISNNFPYVRYACNVEIPVEYSDLIPFAAPNSVLMRFKDQ